jgi:hypothetical protein
MERGYATEQDFKLIDLMTFGERIDEDDGLQDGEFAEQVCSCGKPLRPRGTTCWSCYRRVRAT